VSPAYREVNYPHLKITLVDLMLSVLLVYPHGRRIRRPASIQVGVGTDAEFWYVSPYTMAPPGNFSMLTESKIAIYPT
jgi:hypothetical protein